MTNEQLYIMLRPETKNWIGPLEIKSTPHRRAEQASVIYGLDLALRALDKSILVVRRGLDVFRVEHVKTVHFVLKSVWFEKIRDGSKNVEYRPVTPRWTSILSKSPNIAIFSLGYTRRGRIARVIDKIDVGPCPIPGWIGDYFRIHFYPI